MSPTRPRRDDRGPRAGVFPFAQHGIYEVRRCVVGGVDVPAVLAESTRGAV